MTEGFDVVKKQGERCGDEKAMLSRSWKRCGLWKSGTDPGDRTQDVTEGMVGDVRGTETGPAMTAGKMD